MQRQQLLQRQRVGRGAPRLQSTRLQAHTTKYAVPGELSKFTHFGFATTFHERFDVGELVGSGSFGVVHVCTERASGEQFAVKTIKKKKFGDYLQQLFVKRIQHEVDVYHHMGRSLNIAYMEGVYEDDQHVDMVLELCRGGQLWSRIKRNEYGERQAAAIMRDVLRAIAQCHARGVILRDIKPENFLFVDDSPDSRLVLIDFGIADFCGPDQKLKDRAGTPFYVAPEVLKQSYGQKADLWSAGVIAYLLLAGRLPFEDEDTPGQPLLRGLELTQVTLSNKAIFSAVLFAPLDFTSDPWPRISAAGRDLVSKLLTRDPALRPSAAEALEHPWLQDAPTTTTPTPSTSHAGRASNGNGHGNGNGSGGNDNGALGLGAAGEGLMVLDDTLVQRLQRFGTWAKLKQAFLSKIASFLTRHDAAVLSELTVTLAPPPAAAGAAGSGGASTQRIRYDQLVDELKSGRFDLSDTEVRQLLSCFNVTADGYVDASEWVAALADWQAVQSSPEWPRLLDRAFASLDSDGSGSLGMGELEALLCPGGEDEACPMEDTVPGALREVQGEDALMSGQTHTTPSLVSTPPSPTSASSASSLTAAGAAVLAAGPVGGGGVVAVLREGGPPGVGRAPGGDDDAVIDRRAFERLVRMARQDRLELFQSRRAKERAGAVAAAEEEVEEVIVPGSAEWQVQQVKVTQAAVDGTLGEFMGVGVDAAEGGEGVGKGGAGPVVVVVEPPATATAEEVLGGEAWGVEEVVGARVSPAVL